MAGNQLVAETDLAYGSPLTREQPSFLHIASQFMVLDKLIITP
jgi:hypothetical protein